MTTRGEDLAFRAKVLEIIRDSLSISIRVRETKNQDTAGGEWTDTEVEVKLYLDDELFAEATG